MTYLVDYSLRFEKSYYPLQTFGKRLEYQTSIETIASVWLLKISLIGSF
jgi:hypothetical protein